MSDQSQMIRDAVRAKYASIARSAGAETCYVLFAVVRGDVRGNTDVL